LTTETIIRINKYCDRYGDKLVELMNRCKVLSTPEVPEEDAIQYLKELEEAYESESDENHCG